MTHGRGTFDLGVLLMILALDVMNDAMGDGGDNGGDRWRSDHGWHRNQ